HESSADLPGKHRVITQSAPSGALTCNDFVFRNEGLRWDKMSLARSLDRPQQKVRSLSTYLKAIDSNGGYSRHATACHFEIAETGDRNPFGYGPAAPVAFHDRTECRKIGGAHHCFDVRCGFDQLDN